MARKPRIHCPGALYQVIARGNQQQTIFLHQEDYTAYLSYLSAYKAKFQFRLYACATDAQRYRAEKKHSKLWKDSLPGEERCNILLRLPDPFVPFVRIKNK